MEPFQQDGTEAVFLRDWQKEVPGLTAGFTTRNGGKSEVPFKSLNVGFHVNDDRDTVLENRKIIADLIKTPMDNWVSGEQVHGTSIAAVSSEDRGKGSTNLEKSIKEADGLISNETSILLTGFFADCVPLFFIDPATNWFGIAHAGWKGTVGGIAGKMVQAFCTQGSQADNIKAAIGPSISAANYEVDDQVVSQIPEKWHEEAVIPKEHSKYLIDLKKINELILLESGLNKDNISISSYCTSQNADLFFSHRRDKGKTGRMLGFIGFSKAD